MTAIKYPDISGMRFGRLIAIKPAGTNHLRQKLWECHCDCGQSAIYPGNALRTGRATSCGMHRDEHATRHGGRFLPEYKVWLSMNQRCKNPKSKAYHNYGGRGIRVCEAWENSFQAFFESLGPRPSPSHTLERQNNELGYSPENCIWATRKEQIRNRRTTRLFEFDGELRTATEISEKLGLSYSGVMS